MVDRWLLGRKGSSLLNPSYLAQQVHAEWAQMGALIDFLGFGISFPITKTKKKIQNNPPTPWKKKESKPKHTITQTTQWRVGMYNQHLQFLFRAVSPHLSISGRNFPSQTFSPATHSLQVPLSSGSRRVRHKAHTGSFLGQRWITHRITECCAVPVFHT